MAVPKEYQEDLRLILAKQEDQGGRFWATADGRWGKGSPFSTFDCALLLAELGVSRSDPVMRGAAQQILGNWQKDGKIRPGPKSTTYPCHTANAARALCRLGFARDRRVRTTLEHLLKTQHADGGWRCATVRLGQSDATDASNPGVTLAVLDALRFRAELSQERRLNKAVRFLLAHWNSRTPLGPCSFGIGTLFQQVEFPFLRYNLFYYVYVLSFYESAKKSRPFRQALSLLRSKAIGDQMSVENPHRRLGGLALCKKGAPSRAASRRYRELLRNVEQ